MDPTGRADARTVCPSASSGRRMNNSDRSGRPRRQQRTEPVSRAVRGRPSCGRIEPGSP